MTDKSVASPYAYWTVPGSSFRIVYSLGLFREIDFLVNEGFRRIPHGGVEVGGVLFGKREGSAVRVEAFRPIECEHAAGPSFVLSEHDVSLLRRQLDDSLLDPELAGFEVVGWFIAHTRSALVLNDREDRIFAELFPGLGRFTLLVKPERFQPTRFSFFVRLDDRPLGRDGADIAIILPSMAQDAGDSPAPIASLPAPPPKSSGASKPQPPVEAAPVAHLPPFSGVAAPPLSAESAANASTIMLQDSASEARPDFPEPVPSPPPARSVTAAAAAGGRTARPQAWDDFPSARPTRRLPERRASGLRLALVLLFAAALGCAVGYLAYLQLPPPVIPLTARARDSKVVISWPASQTRNAGYAAIRVDNGQPTPLSSEEKAAGETEITAPGDDVKVELIAQHWLRDSRGILRFLRPAKTAAPTATAAPTTAVP